MTSPTHLLFGTYYHIYNRGCNRENIFFEERNYDHFINLYSKHVEPLVNTFAYCLLRNHFHMLIQVKGEDETSKILRDENKSIAPDAASIRFSNFFNAYAKAINKAYSRTGSLFQHPFGRVAVTNDRQFWAVAAYIHQNPQKHGFVEDFREWKWSSYGVMLSEASTLLQRRSVLEWFGGRDGYVVSHDHWVTDGEGVEFAAEDGELDNF